MSEYTDAHMTDENGVRWVKVEYANRYFAESRTPPAEGREPGMERCLRDIRDLLCTVPNDCFGPGEAGHPMPYPNRDEVINSITAALSAPADTEHPLQSLADSSEEPDHEAGHLVNKNWRGLLADIEQPSPKKIADAILQEYAVLAHDGDKLNGEHYWVGANELATVIRPYLASMDKEQPTVELPDSVTSADEFYDWIHSKQPITAQEARQSLYNIKWRRSDTLLYRGSFQNLRRYIEQTAQGAAQDREDAERWQYLVRVIRNRAEWEAVDEIFEAARIEQWGKAVLDYEIDKVRQQEQG